MSHALRSQVLVNGFVLCQTPVGCPVVFHDVCCGLSSLGAEEPSDKVECEIQP
jgi:hypothetical protein